MAIVVEDGTVVSGANSYISEAELSTYATDRGVTISGTASELIYQAMDYIEAQPFKGIKGTQAQPLQWPRYGVYIDTYYVASDSIPQLLKDAVCEVCIGIDGGVNPLANEERMTISEKVDVISVTYDKNSRNYTYLKAAETKLKKLLSSTGFGISAVAVRG